MRRALRCATHARVSVMCSTGGPGGPGNRIGGGEGDPPSEGFAGSGTTTVLTPAAPSPDPLSILYASVRIPGTDPGVKETDRRAAWYSASEARPLSIRVSPDTVPGIDPLSVSGAPPLYATNPPAESAPPCPTGENPAW